MEFSDFEKVYSRSDLDIEYINLCKSFGLDSRQSFKIFGCLRSFWMSKFFDEHFDMLDDELIPDEIKYLY